MKPQKYYNIDVKTNFLRQLVFTDKNILISLSAIIIVASFYFLRNFDFNIRTFVALFFISIILTLSIIKVDNQKLYEIAPRFIKFIFKKKRVRL